MVALVGSCGHKQKVAWTQPGHLDEAKYKHQWLHRCVHKAVAASVAAFRIGLPTTSNNALRVEATGIPLCYPPQQEGMRI